MDAQTEELIKLLATVAAIALAYGQAFGRYQLHLTDVVCQWFGIPSDRKGGVNLIVGITIAVLFTTAAAWRLGFWWLVPFAPLAGLISATDASTQHDAAKTQVIEAKAEAKVQRAYQTGLRRSPPAEERVERRQLV